MAVGLRVVSGDRLLVQVHLGSKALERGYVHSENTNLECLCVYSDSTSLQDKRNELGFGHSFAEFRQLDMPTLPIADFNHLSIVVSDTRTSALFYKTLLGFAEVKRPSAFEFEGGWLVRGMLALHLIEGKPVRRRRDRIDPKSDHISFVSSVPLSRIEDMLRSMDIPFVKEETREGKDIVLQQIFFADPDGLTVEVCNCDCLPVCLLEQSSRGNGNEDSTSSGHSISTDTAGIL